MEFADKAQPNAKPMTKLMNLVVMFTVQEIPQLTFAAAYQVHKMKTAQVSMEFLFAIGTIFIIFMFILAFTVTKKTEINQLEKVVIAKNECIKLSNLIIKVPLSSISMYG